MISAALCALLAAPAHAEGARFAALQQISAEWDQARYATHDDDAAYAALAELARETEQLSQSAPNDPALLAWRGLIAASQADTSDGFRALRHVREAKTFLDAARMANPDIATRGVIYMTLGELYAFAPGFPISIGNTHHADEAFRASLSADPDALEANVAYGDFLISEKHYTQALEMLHHALQAPARPGREIGDSGARAEAEVLLLRAERLLRH